MRIEEVDVLVVGAGPTGLTAAILLADFGVGAITLNQYPGTAHTPRAHITNIRTMEMFRDIGIEPDIAAVSEKLSFLCNNVMSESLVGTELARYMSYGSGSDRLTDYAQASPTVPLNCAQHMMEPVLLAAARKRGADVRFSERLLAVEDAGERVEARILDINANEEYLVRAKYLIGADGGRSLVAAQCGFEFEGESGLRDMVNVWMDIDLERYTAHRPAVIYSILKPQERGWVNYGAFINVSPWKDWIFSSPGTADIPEEELLNRVRNAVGDPSIDVRVKNISGWQVNHLYATSYIKGRVILAGDAAHRHPPSGGLGTNTSVQDAYNLVWKLALVLEGKAGEGLLNTYHDERMPVGKSIVNRAIQSLYNQDSVAVALGSAEDADECPSIDDIFGDRPGALERRTALAAAVKKQDYRSNALGVELGQQYQSSAVIDDGTPPVRSEKDPELFYAPSTRPGAFVPHVWLEHDRARTSSVDLVGKGRFTLLIGVGGSQWTAAADRLAAQLGIDLAVRQIGYRCEYDDVYGDWTRLRGIADDGALLVRPDGYIAWRTDHMPDEPDAALRAAFDAILSLQEHDRREVA
ncbi:FAD-dependent monooxygenase [Sphingopyxis sp.]|uniref:FAD-dependent monooxygenase n=1 Tax=Sphingopyxis sp. TaxID=1908224 RepID=UPI002B496996|nr:FAD-dependent monooxygenase [Sphingopyxis sp.]